MGGAALLLSPFHSWCGVNLPVPAVAASTATSEGEMCLTGRRVTAYAWMKSEDLEESGLGPSTSEARFQTCLSPNPWVTVS